MNKLLLHVCCAPCSIAIIDELKNQYDLTVFFYNPNIYPESEYLKRKQEVVKVCREWCVSMIDADYDNQNWGEAVKGLEDEPEQGKRCLVCFSWRFRRTAKYAKDNGFNIYASSLTSGRNKQALVINSIGENLAKEFGVDFLPVDWKKDGRQEKSRRMITERNIYRQNYCGCRFSITDNQ